MSYRIPKGVFDILPHDPDPDGQWRHSYLWQYVEKIIRETVSEYGFKEIRTPLFESTDLFQRSIGTATDIVKKEMYTFVDKGNRSLTLRPEGTAPVMRACIEKNLFQQLSIQKLFYIYPMFRYERQQAGRYRQHHQFGVEAIGIASPYQDVEVIHLLWSVYKRLGLSNIHLQIHSIGEEGARARFKEKLKEYLLPHLSSLSEESQERYHLNPFRILDSKNRGDQEILKGGPQLLDFLDQPSKDHFEKVLHLLTELKIPFQINPHLVRGLDYYNQTVFEFVSNELGAQNSLGGGGRYDGLIKDLGGPDLPAFGFGTGIERIIQTMLAQNVFLPPAPHPLLFVIPLGADAILTCFKLVSDLREHHLTVEIDLSEKKLKHAMRYANDIHAKFVTVIGSQELESNHIQLKNMETGAVETLGLDTLLTRLSYELQKNP